jgi:membrane protease subunit (stomatin/prohibitin family)
MHLMAIVDIVTYDGGPEVFAWKYPDDELGTWTQVIVHESQEAVLFKGGQALDVFGPGRHTLDTANIPGLNRLINLPFGGRSPFKAEVWFVNKVHALDVKWGTPTPIQIQDPKYGIFAPVRTHGQFGLQLDQANKFLIKLVGTLPVFDRENVRRYFRGLYLTKAKDAISAYLVHKRISLLEINAYLDELSAHLQERIAPILAEYGIRLVNFFVNDISVPEDDPAITQLKAALAKKAEMNIIGYSYQQERSFDTLEGAATNPGASQAGLMGAGLGLGMGVGLGGAVGGQFGGLAQNLNLAPPPTAQCPQCRAIVPAEARFCPGCGRPLAGSGPVPSKPCPKCGRPLENPGAKFCPHCGEALVRRCGACQAELAEAVTFCPQCGAKV